MELLILLLGGLAANALFGGDSSGSSSRKQCRVCKGSGEITNYAGASYPTQRRRCPACDGAGWT